MIQFSIGLSVKGYFDGEYGGGAGFSGTNLSCVHMP